MVRTAVKACTFDIVSISLLRGNPSVSLQLLKYCSWALFAPKIVRIRPEIGRKVGTMASML
jgi:hypothetical protein